MNDSPTPRTVTVEHATELTSQVYTKYSDEKVVTRGQRLLAITDRYGVRHDVHYPTQSHDFEELIPGVSIKFDRAVTHAGSTTFIETKVTVLVQSHACPVQLLMRDAED